MSGLSGLNKTPNGLVLGLVQLQLPVVETLNKWLHKHSVLWIWWVKRVVAIPAWTWWCFPSMPCMACR